MSKSGATPDLPKLLLWTRAGDVEASWGPYETFESLVFSQALQSQLQKLALGMMGSQDYCAKARLPWRRGAFLFGPGGCGKSAASRAVALLLGWTHVTIGSHEILDAHHLIRALAETTRSRPCVVVLDNVDQLLRRIDENDFFDAFDFASERADGVFWFITSRRPEQLPKNQLVRPGRFEELLRLAPPSNEVKHKYYENYLAPFMNNAEAKAEHLLLLDENENLSFAHLQEMRLLIAKALMDGSPENLVGEFKHFCQEQAIAGDRSGSSSSQTKELEERVKLSDPRLLMSALQVTDAFKKIVEATLANASEALAAAQQDGAGQ